MLILACWVTPDSKAIVAGTTNFQAYCQLNEPLLKRLQADADDVVIHAQVYNTATGAVVGDVVVMTDAGGSDGVLKAGALPIDTTAAGQYHVKFFVGEDFDADNEAMVIAINKGDDDDDDDVEDDEVDADEVAAAYASIRVGAA